MSSIEFADLSIRPLTDEDYPQVDLLFQEYPHKDFQLRQLNIPKRKMAEFLKTTLADPELESACLRQGQRLSGLISARSLPWMSEMFGARMFAIQHFLTRLDSVAYLKTMLRYLLDHMTTADFLDCRVANGDTNAIQALEDNGFRFVGNEVYLARSLIESPAPDEYGDNNCVSCPEQLQNQVIDLVRNTHFHNRFMYDPEVSEHDAAEIYKQYLSGFAFKKDFRSRIVLREGQVEGFILYRFNAAFSKAVGGNYASLDFIGVNPNNRSAGLGEELNKAALYDLAKAGATHVVVRTFGSNYPAVRICHKVGFKITSSDLHFHLWLRPKYDSRRNEKVGPSPASGLGELERKTSL
ncbi:MAG: GNAT family N-acetyltransferase [Deltaproteobacteria bacterium]|nr:GNAT family N-acetyltransferase [Deltaproteobacteria bacterium]